MALLIGVPVLPAAAADFSSYAFVENDGTLRVRGRVVRLYGIHIPDTGRSCNTFFDPPVCGSRAALALDFRIGSSFVHCDTVARHPDRSVTARCTVDDQDLSAYLLERGWALALPDAPFEYAALERIARARGAGVWGLPLRY